MKRPLNDNWTETLKPTSLKTVIHDKWKRKMKCKCSSYVHGFKNFDKLQEKCLKISTDRKGKQRWLTTVHSQWKEFRQPPWTIPVCMNSLLLMINSTEAILPQFEIAFPHFVSCTLYVWPPNMPLILCTDLF